jgi:hypothetical protein
MASPEQLSADNIRWDLNPDGGLDHRDSDIVDIAIAALEEAQSYRVLAQQAIHLLHEQDIQLSKLRERYRRLAEEVRSRRCRRTAPRPKL